MLKKGIMSDVYIAGSKLKYANYFNYLGNKLDNMLTFEKYAVKCLRMVANKLYLLSKVRKYITIGQAISILIMEIFF